MRSIVHGHLDAAFDQLDERVRLTEEGRIEFESRAKEVKDLLIKSQSVHECFLVGSLVRSTALREVSDVDLLAVMNTGESDDVTTPDQLVSELAQTLSFLGEDVVFGEIAVTVLREGPPPVDVIPAKTSCRGGTFLIPAGSDNSWQTYSPSVLNDLVADCADRLGPRFRRLIRLLKYWNHSQGVGLESSDLEEAACIAMRESVALPSYTEAFAQVLNFILKWIDGDGQVQSIIGRAFPTRESSNIIRDAVNRGRLSTRTINESTRELELNTHLLKGFFGGELSDYLH